MIFSWVLLISFICCILIADLECKRHSKAEKKFSEEDSSSFSNNENGDQLGSDESSQERANEKHPRSRKESSKSIYSTISDQRIIKETDSSSENTNSNYLQDIDTDNDKSAEKTLREDSSVRRKQIKPKYLDDEEVYETFERKSYSSNPENRNDIGTASRRTLTEENSISQESEETSRNKEREINELKVSKKRDKKGKDRTEPSDSKSIYHENDVDKTERSRGKTSRENEYNENSRDKTGIENEFNEKSRDKTGSENEYNENSKDKTGSENVYNENSRDKTGSENEYNENSKDKTGSENVHNENSRDKTGSENEYNEKSRDKTGSENEYNENSKDKTGSENVYNENSRDKTGSENEYIEKSRDKTGTENEYNDNRREKTGSENVYNEKSSIIMSKHSYGDLNYQGGRSSEQKHTLTNDSSGASGNAGSGRKHSKDDRSQTKYIEISKPILFTPYDNNVLYSENSVLSTTVSSTKYQTSISNMLSTTTTNKPSKSSTGIINARQDKEEEMVDTLNTAPGIVIKQPFTGRKKCIERTPPCCVPGQVDINLGTINYKARVKGDLDGVSATVSTKPQRAYKRCSNGAVIKVTFDPMGNEGCFGCTKGPFCGRRLLQT
ncbi:GATA zinc finger domain-containing protein 14-like [Ruditapes philippinarum]|uniref:GATA zinc finger domain-containing protein 14-like n=1 Tax=Ruditapes philippinarum TaxID=129788 RepID=UPI00295ADA17|nr:GATA zinc finger domain-containing protein 14-like [Ruditapes philippinarum]